MTTTEVLDVEFVSSGILDAVDLGMRAMESRDAGYVTAPNSEMMLAARRSKRLMRAIREADLVLPEGSGVIYSSYILGMPIKRRITTLDYVSALLARMSEKKRSVFLLGGGEEAAAAVLERMCSRFPGVVLAGNDRGLYDTEEELLSVISAASPDLLLVCFGTPQQELWMNRHKGAVRVGLMAGFGKEMEVLAGITPPVPQKWQDGGYEWLYKLLKEPGSILRVAKRAALLLAALKRRLFG